MIALILGLMRSRLRVVVFLIMLMLGRVSRSWLTPAFFTLLFRSLRTDHLSMKVHPGKAEMVGLMFARMSDCARTVGLRIAVDSALGTRFMTV